MRRLIMLVPLVTLLSTLLPLAAGADCSCREPVERPEMPPENATRSDMMRASTEIESYMSRIVAYRECLVGCIRSAERTLDFITREWNDRVERFNRGKTGEAPQSGGESK